MNVPSPASTPSSRLWWWSPAMAASTTRLMIGATLTCLARSTTTASMPDWMTSSWSTSVTPRTTAAL